MSSKRKPFLRSDEWKALRAQALSRDDNACVLCGRRDHLNVHHMLPRKYFKQHSLELMNLITLCPKHHAFGPSSCHRGSGTFLLMFWLMNNRPDQFQWILENL